MGRELEWKYTVPDAAVLDRIAADPEVCALAAEAARRVEMRSVYYDTPDRLLERNRIALRRRMENETSVICVKTKGTGSGSLALRGEWETEAEDPAAALPRLTALGAPEVLLQIGTLIPVCRADFLRRARLLRFPDGSEAELALDLGTLSGSGTSVPRNEPEPGTPHGAERSIPLIELELELKSGGPDAALAFVTRLAARYGLTPEPRSKYARALALGRD